MRFAATILAGLVLLAGCRAARAPDPARERQAAAPGPSAGRETIPLTAPPAASAARKSDAGPRPAPEAALVDKSAEGAARVVRTYFELVEAGREEEARRLWEGAGEAEFAAGLGRYRDYRVEVGAPGQMEGAAGSSFVTVPVRLDGRLKDGTPFRRKALATLRRVNDVPGSTEDQRRWRIRDIAAGDAPG
jgi:hypothetical protein